MFTFFRRMKTVVSSELNAMLEKAEDPIKMLDQFMLDMGKDIRDAETSVAKQTASEKMLKRKLDDANAKVTKRKKQAEQALQAGDEELARRALEDKQEYEQEVALLQQSWEQSQTDSKLLKEKLDEMKKEYRQMKLKKDSLQARAESAKMRTKLNRTMSTIGNDESKRGFERMEEKVLQYEAEAETSEELKSVDHSLDDAFAKMDNRIDKELIELKKQMNIE